ncbi:hypothetical protein B0H16DRAFT_1889061 [Mycena metata]|uniref:CCHC-type domain-containing protein n=1 Tax=Mycena metata TaxID=1033252 RepID=A0AAD7IMN5_9AGAR|nr:hypothetical protein B0H16DRAFT_1889061 [Mycena metata]
MINPTPNPLDTPAGTPGPSVSFAHPHVTPNMPFPHLKPTQGATSSSASYDTSQTSSLLTEYETEQHDGESDHDIPSLPSSPELPPRRMHSTIPVFGGPARTVLDMPMRNSRDAPKTFKGQHSEVEYFIQHYDKLLMKFHVTDPYDQCECILGYCSTDVQSFIRASVHYQKNDWRRLRREILKCYDAERAVTRFRPSDITTFTIKTKNRPIVNLSQWKKYYIKYKTMAGTLLQQGHITKVNSDVYFWMGIHRDLRRILEYRILQYNTGRDSRKQYTMAEINEAGEWYFRRNRAETMVLNAADYDIEDDGGYNEPTTDEEDSEASSDEDDFATYLRKRKEKNKAKKEKAKRKTTAPSKMPEYVEERTKKSVGSTEEVTGLIRQLNKMSLDDPEYSPVYYAILAKDQTGNAAKCIKPPYIASVGGNMGGMTQQPPSGRREPAFMPANNVPQQSPATYPNNVPLGTGDANVRPPSRNCYGCNGEGHRLNDCPEVRALLQEGIIIHDQADGRLKMKNGTPIQRMRGEGVVQAARRLSTTPRVMLGFVDDYSELEGIFDNKTNQVFYHTQEARIQDYESDDDPGEQDEEVIAEEEQSEDSDSDVGGEVYLSFPKRRDNARNTVNAAERTVPSTRAARRQVFDGVHVPKRDKARGGVETAPLETIVPVPGPTQIPKSKGEIIREALADVQPHDARQPRFTPIQDVEMTSEPPHTKKDKRGTKEGKPLEKSGDSDQTRRKATAGQADGGPNTEPKTSGRQSDIHASVHIPGIVDRLMDLQLPMTVREAIVASKEIRNGIQDIIRLKNVKAVMLGQDSPLVASWTWPRSEGVLIQIEMEIGGRRVVAIVDTGSQLDVVRADVAALVLHRPVDMTRVTNMNDANGGRGQLRGFIHDIELSCGGVLTRTGLRVSQQAPFALLLGRPWQRNNLVTIDEREEGTYLVFKDRETRQPRYELMAIPHEATSEVLAYTAERQTLAFISDTAFISGAGPHTDTGTSRSMNETVSQCKIDLTEAASTQNSNSDLIAAQLEDLRGEQRESTTIWTQASGIFLEIGYLIQIWAYIGILFGGRILLWLERGIYGDLEYKRRRENDGEAPINLPTPTTNLPTTSNPLLQTPFPILHHSPHHPSTSPPQYDPVPMEAARRTLPSDDSTRGDANASAVQAEIQRTIARLEAEQHQRTLTRNGQRRYGVLDQPCEGSPSINVYSAARTQQKNHRAGRALHIRPGMAESVQTVYIGQENKASGQEVHRAVLLNARLLIHDPRTGAPGVRTGHMYAQLYANPTNDEEYWPLEVPCVSHQEVQAVIRRRNHIRGGNEWKVKNVENSPEEPIWLTHSIQATEKIRQLMSGSPPPPGSTSPPRSVGITLRKPSLPTIKEILEEPEGRGRKNSLVHYLTHPPHNPPPCDTTSMTPIGTTRENGHVVLEIRADRGDMIAPAARKRPDTPRLPWILTSERPELAETGDVERQNVEMRQEDSNVAESQSIKESTGEDDAKSTASVAEDGDIEMVELDADGSTDEEDIEFVEIPIEAAGTGPHVVHDSGTDSYVVSNERFEHLAHEWRRGQYESAREEMSEELEEGEIKEAAPLLLSRPLAPSDRVAAAQPLDPRQAKLGDRAKEPEFLLTRGRLIARAHYSSSPSAASTESTADFPPYDAALQCDAQTEHSCNTEDGPAPREILDEAVASVCIQPAFDPARIVHKVPFNKLPFDHVARIERRGFRLLSPTPALDTPPYSPTLEPQPAYRDVAVQTSDESDDFRDLPELLYPSDYEERFHAGRLESNSDVEASPADATDGSDEKDEILDFGPEFLVVDTRELITAMDELHHRAPSPELDDNTAVDTLDDMMLIKPLQSAIFMLVHVLERTLDRVAMTKDDLFELDEFGRLIKDDQEEGERIRRARLARADAGRLDLVSERVAPGKRKIREEPTVPPSRDGRTHRVFSNHAITRGPIFRSAIAAEVMQNHNTIHGLTQVRGNVLDFTRRASNIVARRHWNLDITVLHDPSPVPLPFLFGYEHAKLRVLHNVFEKNGHHNVAEVVEELLRFRFLEPEIMRPISREWGWLLQCRKTVMMGEDSPTRMEMRSPFALVIQRVLRQRGLLPGTVTVVVKRGANRWMETFVFPPPIMAALALLEGKIVTVSPVRGSRSRPMPDRIHRVVIRNRNQTPRNTVWLRFYINMATRQGFMNKPRRL